MRPIQILNTLSGKKELLVPHEPGHVKIYACGVTTYDQCHIGHAMQAIYFDVIRAYLEAAGYRVTYVRNFTDVDDKIIARAAQNGQSPKELAESIIVGACADMEAIGVRPASHEPRVSESIPEIIAMVETLIAKAYAYATAAGDVYYRVRKKENYGCLSHRRIEELQSGTRAIVQGEKEDELDFVLWKADTTPTASWPSPWGLGRPGWHIECSAMAKKYLGASFDIHGGGRDLVFPHHENEIAQSEAANGCSYANIWMHSGLLTIDKQKMSKSLGNHLPIQDFLKKWPAEVLRLAFITQHYSSNTDFSDSFFRRCAQRLVYYYETLLQLAAHAGSSAAGANAEAEAVTESFHAAMSDDFNSALAIGELNKGFRRANELSKGKATVASQAAAASWLKTLPSLFKIFGLLQEEPKGFIAGLKARVLPALGLSSDEIEAQIKARWAARQAKDFGTSDAIRNSLASRGIELRDSPEATDWTFSWAADNS